jgi:peptidoglycan/xylan/chitin deacetylase (PgdA/CDA1 family)
MPVTGIGSAATTDPVASLVTSLNAATAATTAATAAATAATAVATTAATTYVSQSLATIGPTLFPPKPRLTMVQTFQSGHGWSLSADSTGTAAVADTTNYVLGSQSLRGVTAGSTNFFRLTKSALTAVNLTGKGIAVLVKADWSKFGTVYVLLGNGGFATFRTLQMSMIYGGLEGDQGWNDTWRWFYCPVTDTSAADSGAFDVTAVTDWRINVYDKGSGALTANVQAIGYFTQPTTYSGGVVTFTFDDAFVSQRTLAAPVLDTYGVGASAFPIVDLVGQSGRLTLAQLHELEQYHGWEVCGHAYTAANHDLSGGYADLSASALATEVYNVKSWLRVNGFRGNNWFAWPQGLNDSTTAAAVGNAFSWARHTTGRYSHQYPEVPMRAQAVALTSDTSMATLQGYIDVAKAKGRWLVFVCHDVKSSGASGTTQLNVADLTTIVNYCQSQSVPIRTVGEVLGTVT